LDLEYKELKELKYKVIRLWVYIVFINPEISREISSDKKDSFLYDSSSIF